MGRLGEIWRRVQMLMRREEFDRELDEEMRLHREMKVRELASDGVNKDEARYAANRAFGNATVLRERGREAWGWRWLEDFAQDCVYGVRGLWKSPGYAATAVITLILGTGATTAIFSVVNTVLLRPLPYVDPGRLARIEENHETGSSGFPGSAYFAENFSYANYLDLAATPHKSLEAVGAYRDWTFNVSGGIGGAEPAQVNGAMISANLFAVLGIATEIGRGFTEHEQRVGADNVAILSYGLWRRQFGADPGAVGKTIRVSNVPHVIVGVMPPGFQFPEGAGIWTPLVTNDELHSNRRSHLLGVIGRLATGVSVAQSESELRAFADSVQEQNPGVDPGFQLVVRSLREHITAPVRPALLVLLGAVSLMLLAACANVANLVLMRNTTRAREFAVRSALGAGHGRLLRQCLAESALLGFVGAAGGVLFAVWCLKLVVAFAPQGVPRLGEVRVDGVVLAFAAGLSLLTALVFGVVPAVEASRLDPNGALKEGAKGTTSVKGARLRGALVVAEIALALMLLAGGGLLMNSFVRLSRVWPGFDETNLLTANFFLSPNRYRDEQIAPFLERLLERVRAIPGVESAGVVNTLPVSGGVGTDFVIEGRPLPAQNDEPSADICIVAGDYFGTMRIPLLRGRWFDAHDTESSVNVMVINETMAERYWPGENPVGKHVTMRDWGPPLKGEVVGVVGNVKSDTLDAQPGNMIYWPERQFPSIFDNLVVRSSRDPLALAGALKAAVWSVDADLPLASIATMEERLTESVGARRVQTLLLSVFAGLALLMAAVGTYGVMAYSVSGRGREIGIRMALGANQRAVRNLVLREGLRWTAIGVGIGLMGALGLAGLLSGLLYGVAPRDPVTLGAATLLLGLVAMLACYVPTRRAMRVDPILVLRSE
jgi:putative ABC transport system permease protein